MVKTIQLLSYFARLQDKIYQVFLKFKIRNTLARDLFVQHHAEEDEKYIEGWQDKKKLDICIQHVGRSKLNQDPEIEDPTTDKLSRGHRHDHLQTLKIKFSSLLIEFAIPPKILKTFRLFCITSVSNHPPPNNRD